MAETAYKPALRYHALTRLFDPVAALSVRERAVKARVLERAALAPGEEVLDIGCGTGTLALVALRAQPAARVTGLDADPEILARARRKAARAGVEVTFDEGLSTRLPYGDASFDVVVSTLVFHHLRDPDKVSTGEEIARVLRPGGRVVVADMGRSQDPLMRTASLLTFQLLDGFETTSSSVAGRLPEMLSKAGLRSVRVTDRLRTPVGTVELVEARA